ncbi:hypothetical protein NFI96_028671, partial [Prochilodus magdalenae]
MDESGLEPYLSDCTVPSVEFGGGGIMVWGCGSGVGLRPLVPVRGTLNASADQETLDHSMLLTLWGQFGDGPFLFQHEPPTPGHSLMKVVMLLLLYAPMTTAVSIRHSRRLNVDPLSLVETQQDITSVDGPRETPDMAAGSGTTDTAHHQPVVPTLLRNILMESVQARSRRAAQKGCQFGTCQVHNLASTLYIYARVPVLTTPSTELSGSTCPSA